MSLLKRSTNQIYRTAPTMEVIGLRHKSRITYLLLKNNINSSVQKKGKYSKMPMNECNKFPITPFKQSTKILIVCNSRVWRLYIASYSQNFSKKISSLKVEEQVASNDNNMNLYWIQNIPLKATT